LSSAPAVDRAVKVLDFLAAHPAERFGVSELARRLEISKATCHAVVSSLSEAGYLLRHPGQLTYSLGPGVIALGAAAQARFGALDVARDELPELADELGVECIVSAAVGHEIVLLARAGPQTALGLAASVGQRVPLAPPLGAVFLAWSPAEVVEDWLQRSGSKGAQRDRHQAALAEVRRRGYAATVDRASYPVNTVAVPVFGPDSSVELALTAAGFPDRLPAKAVPGCARRLRVSAARVSAAIHGVAPRAPG
jgi:DNA-binding IclR family transcriptional regulator